MGRTVILSGARTPLGKFGGGLSSLTAGQLGGIAVKGAIERAGINPEEVDEVILGNVLQGGQGQIPSRQASRHAGLPWEVKTETVNKVCASGMRAITLADQIIRCGDGEVVVAGGMESMSNAPYILPQARWGLRMNDGVVKDLMVNDGLTCSFSGVHMGEYGDASSVEYDISREEQDAWALRSHQRAVESIKSGIFAEEIIPVEIPNRKGGPIIVEHDELPRADTSLEELGKLKPVFNSDGMITAGNASGINDGAAALVLTSEERALKEGRKPEAIILHHTAIAMEAKDFPITPGVVIKELLKETGRKLEEIDLFGINEAFAAVALANIKITGLDPEKLNVNGGAVALGHPIGCSGARIIVTLVNELKRRGGGLGIAAICSGGGQGDAVLVEVPKN